MNKAFKMFISAALAYSMCVPAIAAETDSSPSQWAVEDMEFAVEEGLMPSGYIDKARYDIKHEELLVLVASFYSRYTGKQISSSSATPFSDVDSAFITGAYELGIVGNSDNGMFERSRPVTRGELALMMYNTLKAAGVNLTKSRTAGVSFADSSEISDEYIEAVNFLAGHSIMRGIDGKFRQDDVVSVEQAVSAFVKLYSVFMKQNISINGKSIGFGESVEQLKADFGEPARIDSTVYGYERYVYSQDLRNFFMVGIKDGLVVDVFTSAGNFKYKEISSGSNALEIKGLLRDDVSNQSVTIEDTYMNVKAVYNITGGTKLVEAIHIIDKEADVKNVRYYTDETKISLINETYDVINSVRARAGAPLVSRSENAEASAGSHAAHMASNGSVGYEGPNGDDPFDRMIQAGIQYSEAAEVVAYSSSEIVDIYAGILSNAGKRTNIMNPTLINAGAGIAFSGVSMYVAVDLYR